MIHATVVFPVGWLERRVEVAMTGSVLGRRRLVLATVLLGIAGLLVSTLPAATPVQAAGRWVHPSTMASVAGSDQVVVVQAGNTSTTYAYVTAWEKRDGTWRLVRGPIVARLGFNGLSNRGLGDRRQGDGSTPTGTYSFGIGFGSGANPGTKLRWRQINGNDYWTYDPLDPKTYNIFQVMRPKQAKWRLARAERLVSYGKQYEYTAVINFNTPRGVYYSRGQYVTKTPAKTSRGGGIFLHVNGPGATAGCVSIPRTDMKSIVKWLDPAKKPRIVIGTPQILNRL